MRWPWQKRVATGKTASALEAAKQAYAAGSRAVTTGRFDEAVTAFERAATLVPEWTEAHINAGSGCYQLAQNSAEASRALWLSKAESHFVAALRLAPDNVSASLNLAATLHALGRAAEALAVLESLATDYPDLRDVHYNLAVGYAQAGEMEKARASVAEELRRYPSHRAAGELLARLDPDSAGS
ncbi:MAG: tetratricopeptide repeat protein [Armatimonadetes bacterium]|nr:tetratricopeptide repeat protein [Armatimonadota bacterium]